MSTRGRPASDPRPRSPSTAGSTSLVRVDRWSTAWPSADAGWSPTHPGGPGRFRMRAGHQCRNDGTHVDDVRATSSGSAFQDLRNRRTQLPSCPAPLHDKSCQLSRSRCLHFCACRHLAAGRRPDAEPRTGWLRLGSAVSRPDKRHGFQFGRRRRGFGCGGRFLARAEVGHPGARMPGRRWRPRRIG